MVFEEQQKQCIAIKVCLVSKEAIIEKGCKPLRDTRGNQTAVSESQRDSHVFVFKEEIFCSFSGDIGM